MTDPILRDFPERFESERLLIRAPHPGHGAEIREGPIAAERVGGNAESAGRYGIRKTRWASLRNLDR